MPFVIGESCLGTTDQACVEECPVDCIYLGNQMAYIHPTECIDCGACVDVCPVDAISSANNLDPTNIFIQQNIQFFQELLPGRSQILGSPGGARKIGPIGTDTEYINDLSHNSIF